MREDFWRGQDGNGARGSGRRGANNGRSTEEIRRTSAKEKATLEIISIYLVEVREWFGVTQEEVLD